MQTTVNMCIPRASLTSFMCISASMIFILRIHAIGVSEGVTLLEFKGANQEEEPEVQEADEAVTAEELPECHYKIFGLLQRQKSVAKDPKMVAIVILLPIFFWLNVVALVRVAIA